MRKKLTISVLTMLLIILLMITGSQVIIKFFKNTTEKLIIEYHELHALQEYKLSLSRFLMIESDFIVSQKDISQVDVKAILEDSKIKLAKCNQVLTKLHKSSLWIELETITYSLDSTVNFLFQVNVEEASKVNKLFFVIINEGLEKVDILINETKEEIEIYEKRSRTVILHGTFTVIAFGTILILILLVGGMRFVHNLTNPIRELLTATQQISLGDRKSRVYVHSGDEFQTLADSFNEMLNILDNTTVTKEYLKNIINNMFGALVVTDRNYIIRSVNNTSLKLLGYNETELIGQHIMVLFKSEYREPTVTTSSESTLNRYKEIVNAYSQLFLKSGDSIPAFISCTLLKNENNEAEGLILVWHDLTEKMAYEEQLEQNRKENIIAINEAQEEERMRIAIDIHDGLGQLLTAISYSIQEINGEENDKLSPKSKIQKQIDLAIQEAKNLAHNLIPILLKDFGLIAAIQDLIDKANSLYNINFIFNSYDLSERIDPKLEKALYRICQESLTNIVRHSKAKNSTFQLFGSHENVVLVIDDDGVGFDLKSLDSKDRRTGIGLIGIRERVTSFNGIFTINSQTGKGTELIIEVPCRKSDNYGTT